jgi:RimJ/RimL family protein N-acetyltransferase
VQEGCLRQARYYNAAYADIFSFGLLRKEYRGGDKFQIPNDK